MGDFEIVHFDPAVLTGLLDRRFSVSVAVAGPADAHLFPEELAYIEGAVAKRRMEFATTRLCAHKVLSELGVAPWPLVPRSDRSPRWPNGVTGSITHSHGVCAVAATIASEVVGLGIDIEHDEPLPDELWPMICTTSEREWLATMPPGARPCLAKMIFCAKEAVYKCQYAISSLFLDFADVQIEFDVDAGRALSGAALSGKFTAVPSAFTQRAPGWLAQLRGRIQSVPGYVIAVAILENAGGIKCREGAGALGAPALVQGATPKGLMASSCSAAV